MWSWGQLPRARDRYSPRAGDSYCVELGTAPKPQARDSESGTDTGARDRLHPVRDKAPREPGTESGTAHSSTAQAASPAAQLSQAAQQHSPASQPSQPAQQVRLLGVMGKAGSREGVGSVGQGGESKVKR